MGRNFALRGRTRRIARAVVETMGPRWPDFHVDLTDRVLEGLENTVRHFPLPVQTAFVAGLWALEVASPLAGGGLAPFSEADPMTRERRLRAIQASPVVQVRQALQLFGVFITMNAYGQPEVEAFLGAGRLAWRESRRRFREQLVQLDESRGRPATPAHLGSAGLAPEDAYLDDDPAAPAPLRAMGE
jgi:hypothetical protein